MSKILILVSLNVKTVASPPRQYYLLLIKCQIVTLCDSIKYDRFTQSVMSNLLK